jgi:hypothetical protein
VLCLLLVAVLSQLVLWLQMRDEEVFKGLDTMVKNFLVSVPLVADLRSPAMRDRHWQQLIDATKVTAMLVACTIR